MDYEFRLSSNKAILDHLTAAHVRKLGNFVNLTCVCVFLKLINSLLHDYCNYCNYLLMFHGVPS